MAAVKENNDKMKRWLIECWFDGDWRERFEAIVFDSLPPMGQFEKTIKLLILGAHQCFYCFKPV